MVLGSRCYEVDRPVSQGRLKISQFEASLHSYLAPSALQKPVKLTWYLPVRAMGAIHFKHL